MSMRQLKISKSITNRESESLDMYLQEIGKVDMVTPEEEVRLRQLIKRGSQEALDTLVTANLRFVVSVAKQYQNQGLGLPDLINEGNIGLIKAAQRFDETRGLKFISYAVWWIRQSILEALAKQARLVDLPGDKVAAVNKLRQTMDALEQKYEREVSVEEIAEAMNTEPEQVEFNLSISGRHVSIDAPINDDDDKTYVNVMSDPDEIATDFEVDHIQSMKEDVDIFLNSVTERQKMILRWFFGIGMEHALSLEKIGEKLKLTTERVRQIKDRALRDLRKSPYKNVLRKYLG